MRVPPAQVKEELEQRINAISKYDFVHQYVGHALPEYRSMSIRPDDVTFCTIQNDGTGPACVAFQIGGATQLFAKLYPDASGSHAYDVLCHLWHNGFHRGQRHQVPEPLCFVAEYNLLLMRAAQGACLAAYLTQDHARAIEGVREAARWLRQLHRSPVRVGQAEQPWYIFLKLSDRLSKAVAEHPQELKRLTALLDRLSALAADRQEGQMVQVHGQFRPIHVFLSSETVSVIDLDRSRPADPAKDVAEFIHRLRSTVMRVSKSRHHANTLTRAFLDEYTAEAPFWLDNLSFYQGFHIVVSLCRHLKKLQADDPEWEPMINFYVEELEDAISGQFLPERVIVR